ncbi:MAG TPA: alkaline phosphatase family protein [Gemmatimonadaceae bacterium]|nr:alkaline phosphatase family protein [Gemmatimonadaceae bacterium]
MPKIFPPALAVLVSAALAACGHDGATAPDATPHTTLPAVDRVVVVSIDGLRGDALPWMPALDALRARAAWTDSMQTVVPSLTVPGHLTMFTGRDVTKLGVTTNTLDQQAGYALTMNGASTMFQWVKGAGGRSAALIASSLVPAADLETARAFLGIDQLTAVGTNLDELRTQALALATAPDAPELLFVHVATVDFAGHDFGWIRTDTTGANGADVLGPQYVDAARAADGVVDAIRAALEPAIASGAVALIVTADHGGGHGEHCVANVVAAREHCTSQPGDRTIPFFVLAKDVAPGRIVGATSIMQVAPTVGALLRLAVPSRAGAPVR